MLQLSSCQLPSIVSLWASNQLRGFIQPTRARLLSGVKDFEKEGEGFGSHVGDFDFSIDGLFQRMLEHGQENGTASRQNVPMSFELLSKLKYVIVKWTNLRG